MSIKKPLIGLVIFGLLFTGFSLSEAIFTWWGIEVISESDEETVLTTNVNIASASASLWWIDVRFCNNWLEKLTRKISYVLWQTEKWEICVIVKNNWPKDVKVNLSFLPTSLIEGDWSLSCDHNMENVFGSFMDNSKVQVQVPAWDYIVQNFSIQFPLWIKGKQIWCLFYDVEKEDTSAGGIGIIVWKAMFLDYFVLEPGEMLNEETLNEEIINDLELQIINKEIIDRELIVTVAVRNLGNIDLKTEISGALTNILGIKRDFSLAGEIARANGSFVFSLNFGQLPSYKGLFSIDISAKHTPYFDVSSLEIDPSILEEKETSVSSFYFGTPRIILGMILVIIILLILASKKDENKPLKIK